MSTFLIIDDEWNEIDGQDAAEDLDTAISMATAQMARPNYIADINAKISIYKLMATVEHAGPPPIKITRDEEEAGG